MKLWTSLLISLVPICAQATICEQFLQTTELLKQAKLEAHREWTQRSLTKRIEDFVNHTQKPEATLIIEKEKLTSQISIHFDRVFEAGNMVKLIRYFMPARNAYEELAHFEATKIDQLTEGDEYAMHLASKPGRESYLQGLVLRKTASGDLVFLDYNSRIVNKVGAEELRGAKPADLGGFPLQTFKKIAGGKDSWVWENNSELPLLEILKMNLESQDQLGILVDSGTSYKIESFHIVPLGAINRLRINGNEISIPDLNLTVKADQVRALLRL